MLSIPQSYEDALWEAARAELGDDAVDSAPLRRAIVARSKRYTSDRELLDEPLSGLPATLDVAARALFFSPADAPKAMLPARELLRAGALSGAEPLKVLDVGAGVGAMSLGLAAALGAERLRVTAIDRDSVAERVFSRCARRLGLDVTVHTGNVVRFDPGLGLYDIAIAGGVLNELPESEAAAVVDRMLDAVGDAGAVIIVEPALRETSRTLHEIRDSVIAGGRATVFAPCTRTGAPCPALADERDWCHEDRRVELTRRTAQLARATGLRDSGLKFSYLVLCKRPLAQVPATPGRIVLRVVSQPRKTKGKLECFACGERGRDRLRLLNRQRSDGNRVFARARRGDVVVVPETVDSNIPSDAVVDLFAEPSST